MPDSLIPADWLVTREDTDAADMKYLSSEVAKQHEWTILHDAGFLRQAASAAYEGNWDELGNQPSRFNSTTGEWSRRGDLPGVARHSWIYQPNLSDMRRAVWANPRINAVLISYRGTNAGGPS